MRWEHANCSPDLMRVRNKIGPSGLAAIRQADFDDCRQPPTPSADFERLTGLLPDLVAETVLSRVGHSLSDDQVKWFVNHADMWTRWFHANNARWRRSLQSNGNAGRDRLYDFVKHWLLAIAKTRNGIRSTTRLPPYKGRPCTAFPFKTTP